VYVAESAANEDPDLFLRRWHGSLHLSGLQAADEFLGPDIERPIGKVEILDRLEPPRKGGAVELAQDDRADVAPARGSSSFKGVDGFMTAELAL